MEARSMICETLVTNLPLFFVLVIGFFSLRGKPNSGLFLLGLLLILAGGLLALPVTDWLWSHYPQFMSNSTLGTSLVVLALGLIHSSGLLCCVIAFRRGSRDA